MTRGAAFYQEYFRDGSQDPIGCLVFGSKNGTGKFWIISVPRRRKRRALKDMLTDGERSVQKVLYSDQFICSQSQHYKGDPIPNPYHALVDYHWDVLQKSMSQTINLKVIPAAQT